MELKELKERIDEMYKKYGNISVTIDVTLNEDLDETITECKNEHIWTENIQDVTEVKDENGVCGICISNYIMEDKNWGKE